MYKKWLEKMKKLGPKRAFYISTTLKLANLCSDNFSKNKMKLEKTLLN